MSRNDRRVQCSPRPVRRARAAGMIAHAYDLTQAPDLR